MENKRKEHTQRAMERLHVGQSVYLAFWDTPDEEESDIVLEKAVIRRIPETGDQIELTRANGEECFFYVSQRSEDEFHLGTYEPGSTMQWWGFLSEENFWLWREWYILTDRLCAQGVDCRNGYSDYPTEENLKIARLLYDILINQNLSYQSLSCFGCDFEEARDKDHCAQCVRSMTFVDRWQVQKSNHKKCPLLFEDDQ